MMLDRYRWKFVSVGLLTVCAAAVGCNLSASRQNSVGRKAYESGQTSQAIAEFQRALTMDPQNSDAYYNLASSYYQLGKQSQNQQWIAQSEQLFRQSIALDDNNVDAHRALAVLLIETNREKDAFELVENWKLRQPTSAEPLIEIARLYQEFGDNRRATDYLSDAVRVDSSNVRALKALGYVREQQGQLNLALDNYNRALALDNRQADVAQRIQQINVRMAQQTQTTTR
jgi:Tfp pilus assembly protein PilF